MLDEEKGSLFKRPPLLKKINKYIHMRKEEKKIKNYNN